MWLPGHVVLCARIRKSQWGRAEQERQEGYEAARLDGVAMAELRWAVHSEHAAEAEEMWWSMLGVHVAVVSGAATAAQLRVLAQRGGSVSVLHVHINITQLDLVCDEVLHVRLRHNERTADVVLRELERRARCGWLSVTQQMVDSVMSCYVQSERLTGTRRCSRH